MQLGATLSTPTLGKYGLLIFCPPFSRIVSTLCHQIWPYGTKIAFKIRELWCKLFFNVVTPSVLHLFDHLLWSIFQSSITHYIYQFLQNVMCILRQVTILHVHTFPHLALPTLFFKYASNLQYLLWKKICLQRYEFTFIRIYAIVPWLVNNK